jgi:glycine/D-amino acid oxidase-like deaminating enzyme
MDTAYDAIIVGARCAGSPTAMLLARKGYRVPRAGDDVNPQQERNRSWWSSAMYFG